MLKEVVHLLNLSHADSNDLPLAAPHQPGGPAQSPLGYQRGAEILPKGYQGIAEASPGGFPLTQQGIVNSPRLVEHSALSPVEQALYQRQYSRPELPDLLRGPSTEPQYSQRESYEYSQSHRAGSVYSLTHDFASAQSHDLQYPLMQNSGESGYRSSMDPESTSQHPGEGPQGSFADAQRRSVEFVHRPSVDPQPAERQSVEFVHRPSVDPQPAERRSVEFVHRSSADPQQAQQQPRELVRCVSKEQLARHQATYWSTWHPHAEDDKMLQRRYLSAWLQVAAVNTQELGHMHYTAATRGHLLCWLSELCCVLLVSSKALTAVDRLDGSVDFMNAPLQNYNLHCVKQQESTPDAESSTCLLSDFAITCLFDKEEDNAIKVCFNTAQTQLVRSPCCPADTAFCWAEMPSVGLTIPFVGQTLPSDGLTMPFVGQTLPSVGLTLPYVGLTLPFVGLKMPFVRLTLPSVGLTLPP